MKSSVEKGGRQIPAISINPQDSVARLPLEHRADLSGVDEAIRCPGGWRPEPAGWVDVVPLRERPGDFHYEVLRVLAALWFLPSARSVQSAVNSGAWVPIPNFLTTDHADFTDSNRRIPTLPDLFSREGAKPQRRRIELSRTTRKTQKWRRNEVGLFLPRGPRSLRFNPIHFNRG